MKAVTVSFVLLFSYTIATAQYFSWGQDPASLQWRQIHTPHFRIIYPEEWENQAKELGLLLEEIREPMLYPGTRWVDRFPVILRTQTMVSNGFVTWAPRRMELFTTPPPDQQPTEWMKYLPVHEFRHVAQIHGINHSLTKTLSDFFGEHITGAIAGLHLPLWFLEGDAVLAETSYTHSGRGRLPSFYMPLTAQLCEKGMYSFDKALFGSYRDMVPNHYIMGYHLVASIHGKHGNLPFENALKSVGEMPYMPGIFALSIRKTTSKKPAEHYREIFTGLKDSWQKQLDAEPTSDSTLITYGNPHEYADYHSPHFAGENGIIAMKTNPGDITRLVAIDNNGFEKVLFTPGYTFSSSLSAAGGKAAWIEARPDPRWGFRIFSDIRVLDLATGKAYWLTSNERYQSPAVSPDGSKIAAIHIDDMNRCELVILNTNDGMVISRFHDPLVSQLADPAWNEDNTTLYAIAIDPTKGKSIIQIQEGKDKAKTIFASHHTDISKPFAHQHQLWFTGSWSGRDELYCLDLKQNRLYRAVRERYGANHGTLDTEGKKVVFRQLTPTGYKVTVSEKQKLVPVKMNEITDVSPRLYERAVSETPFTVENVLLPDRTFQSKKYNKLINSINYHSWWPVALNIEDMTSNPGISFYSQDLLGTITAAIGGELDLMKKGGRLFADITSRAWYPVIRLRAESGYENRNYLLPGNELYETRTEVRKAILGISLPLQYIRQAYVAGIISRISTSFEHSAFSIRNTNYRRNLQSIAYRNTAYVYHRLAYRDLYPRLGVVLSGGFSHTPLARQNHANLISKGRLIFADAVFYLPGIAPHHSTRIYTGIEHRKQGLTAFSHAIRMARGYEITSFGTISTLSLNYALPLWYPDLAIGALAYFKRIKANVFFDTGYVPEKQGKKFLSVVGLDISSDLHLFRIPIPFEMGIRSMYLFENGKIGIEILSGVDFYAIGRILGFGHERLPRF